MAFPQSVYALSYQAPPVHYNKSPHRWLACVVLKQKLNIFFTRMKFSNRNSLYVQSYIYTHTYAWANIRLILQYSNIQQSIFKLKLQAIVELHSKGHPCVFGVNIFWWKSCQLLKCFTKISHCMLVTNVLMLSIGIIKLSNRQQYATLNSYKMG